MAIVVERPILLVKKLAGMLLLLFGLLLTAVGLSSESAGFTAIGIAFLVAGAISLALKIVRRNQGAVAELVGIEVGVVSGVINLESSGVEASDWRLRHEQAYHEARFLAACD